MKRTIPLVVPDNWSVTRWANYCRYMASACKAVRPDLAREWMDACEFATHGRLLTEELPLGPVEPVGLEALLG